MMLKSSGDGVIRRGGVRGAGVRINGMRERAGGGGIENPATLGQDGNWSGGITVGIELYFSGNIRVAMGVPGVGVFHRPERGVLVMVAVPPGNGVRVDIGVLVAVGV